jgi:hypothetical protein
MAGDWIKIEHGLLGKPEVMLLADALDASPHEVVGHLVAFWLWVDLNLSPDCPGTEQGTREEKRREEYSNIDTLPEWLKKDWVRWLDFRFAKDGQWMPEAQADAIIMDLLRRGEAKALKDIEFSIRIGAKNICHDDGGQGMLNTGGGKGGSTAGSQGGRKLSAAEKTAQLLEDVKNGLV